jgi:carbonic anhydrase
MVDYPRYSSDGSDYSDLHHFDIKYPGEHTIKGESFDAELQMFHVHLHDGRFSSIGIPIRATGNGTNEEFQFILDEFQKVYDNDAEECQMNQARKLRGTDKESFERLRPKNGDNPSTDQHDRRLELMDEINTMKFNPYSDAFMTTMFFYRYDGSITEPPCKDITWWVIKDPMYIDFEQLNQLRDILFTHVDRNCEKTSVHNKEQSVARPIQALGDRTIEFCQEGDFRSDESKGRPAGKQCRMQAP